MRLQKIGIVAIPLGLCRLTQSGIQEKKEGNVFKRIFEDGFGVLRLDWHDPQVELHDSLAKDTAWYHVPWTNQLTWLSTTIRMVPDIDLENMRLARVHGNIALRAAPDGLEKLASRHCPLEILDLEKCPKQFSACDLSLACSWSIYTLVEDSNRLVTEFVPAEQEVHQMTSPRLLWPGKCALQPAPIVDNPDEEGNKGDGGEQEVLPWVDFFENLVESRLLEEEPPEQVEEGEAMRRRKRRKYQGRPKDLHDSMAEFRLHGPGCGWFDDILQVSKPPLHFEV